MASETSVEWVKDRIRSACHGRDLENYLVHARRYAASLAWIPSLSGRVADLGSGAGLFPTFIRELRKFQVESSNFDFDLEKAPAPYGMGALDGVLLMEVLEHFAVDPMFALAEINRITKPGGFLFLTTPNLSSWRALNALVRHQSPYLFGVFTRDGSTNRHNREYTAEEVRRLVSGAGFQVERLEAINVYDASDDSPAIPGADPSNRGDTTFCIARKTGPVSDRYPSWLYW